jgi:uncharacterized membrane protein YqjE
MADLFLGFTLLKQALQGKREPYENKPGPAPTRLEIVQLILAVVITLYAGGLAWFSGESQNIFFRIFMTVVALLFSVLYLIGFLIIKVLMA